MKKSQKRFKINTQYLLIGKYLQQFDNNELTLDRLISELEVVLATFPNSNEIWKQKFKSEWWTLEQVYAVACDRGETTLNPESENLVHKTLDNMKELLKDVIQGPIDEAMTITLSQNLSKTIIK